MYCGALVAPEPAPAPSAALPREAPPPSSRRSTGYIRARRNWTGLAVLAAALLAAGGIAQRFLGRGPEPPAGADPDTYRVAAGGVHVWPREILEACEARFTVAALEGECRVAWGPIRSAGGVSPQEREALDAESTAVREGETRTLSGTCRRGSYAWAVFATRGKPARVRVAFEFK